MSSVEIRPVSGIAVEPWLDELAGLRIRIFRDYPYLYDGDESYERRYLDRYARSDRSLFVLALEYNQVVGVASALPLEDADQELLAPFQQRGLAPERVYYFGESVLLPEYRGQGIGHRFFDLRELYASDFGFSTTAFCSVVRPVDDPRRPDGYTGLEPFWRSRGYRPAAGLTTGFFWRDRGEQEETRKAMQFWLRDAVE
ncbi:GNAT family N-acetyltransferase [Alloalcanivorax xenomutans]|uniref:GNAT family N-acetyltransferase n=1 Tax=Alloalcanivorax xenomutans TaxID=1094342 RepID=UPI003D9BA43B